MNLPPRWVQFLCDNGHEAIHWSAVGDPRALDSLIMSWAIENRYVIFTHDLDFSALLAMTHAFGPSVLQVRTQRIFPEEIGEWVIRALDTHREALDSGAIVTLDLQKSRIRILPIAHSR
jgi:predicted nuclease of predicted toxin-antitoxin system